MIWYRLCAIVGYAWVLISIINHYRPWRVKNADNINVDWFPNKQRAQERCNELNIPLDAVVTSEDWRQDVNFYNSEEHDGHLDGLIAAEEGS